MNFNLGDLIPYLVVAILGGGFLYYYRRLKKVKEFRDKQTERYEDERKELKVIHTQKEEEIDKATPEEKAKTFDEFVDKYKEEEEE